MSVAVKTRPAKNLPGAKSGLRGQTRCGLLFYGGIVEQYCKTGDAQGGERETLCVESTTNWLDT